MALADGGSGRPEGRVKEVLGRRGCVLQGAKEGSGQGAACLLLLSIASPQSLGRAGQACLRLSLPFPSEGTPMTPGTPKSRSGHRTRRERSST